MELVHKSIHMELGKAEGNIQTALEEDVNVAENKPDVEKILLTRGAVKIDEIKVAASHALVKGKLLYHLLYRTQENGVAMQSIRGELIFTEDIYMNGLESGDHVTLQSKVEDLTVNPINSRKLNIRALLSLHAAADEVGEEVICTNVVDAGTIACQKENKEFLELISHKKDIYRIKDEVVLPKGFPNIERILWQDIWLQDFQYQAQEGQILLKGNLVVFFLYQGLQYVEHEQDAEDSEGAIQRLSWYQMTVPFQGSLSEPGSHSGMLVDIQATLMNEPVEIRQDADQEPRAIGIESNLHLDIYLYQPQQLDILMDAYGVDQEVICTRKKRFLQNLTLQQSETVHIAERLSLAQTEELAKQILYGTGTIHLEDAKIENSEADMKQNIVMEGYVQVDLLYEAVQEEGEPEQYAVSNMQVPFTVSIPLPAKMNACRFHVTAYPLALDFMMIDAENVDLKGTLEIRVYAYCEEQGELLDEITTQPLDMEKIKELPGMLIYYVQQDDTLWQIGKKYYMLVDKIKEMNHLSGEVIKPGDKLLLMKSIS